MLDFLLSVNYSNFFFFGFSPILALAAYYYIKKERHITILVSLVLVVLPGLFGYLIRIPFFNKIGLVLIFAILFAFLLYKVHSDKSRIRVSLVFSFLIFGFVLLLYYFSSLFVRYETRTVCKNELYLVEENVETPFVGRGSIDYVLFDKKFFGLFKKKIQAVSDNPFDKTGNCLFLFDRVNVYYNKCKIKIVPKQ